MKHKIPQYINIGIAVLELFKDMVGFNDKQFIEYMNKNNIWNELNDTHAINGCMCANKIDILCLFGEGLDMSEKKRIAAKYMD